MSNEAVGVIEIFLGQGLGPAQVVSVRLGPGQIVDGQLLVEADGCVRFKPLDNSIELNAHRNKAQRLRTSR